MPKNYLLGKIGNLGQICPKIMQPYISWSDLRHFSDVLAWYDAISRQKQYQTIFKKKFVVGQIG